MEYNAIPGIIYDCSNYNVMYFNRETYKIHARIFSQKEDEIFINFDEMRKEKYPLDPPECLYPFFYYNLKRPCLLTSYLDKYFDLNTISYKEFFQDLKSVHRLKRFTFFYYMDNLGKDIDIEAAINGDGKNITKALMCLEVKKEYIDSFVNVMYNFNEIAEKLILYLSRLVGKIEKYHKRKMESIKDFEKNSFSKNIFNFLRKVFNIDDLIKIENQDYSISYINRYVKKYQSSGNKNKAIFVFGDKFYKIDFLYSINYKHINSESISKIFFTPIIKSIVEELKNGEKTITQLSFAIHSSRITVERYVSWLSKELAIKISRKDGNEVYYEINKNYFIAADNIFHNEMLKFIN